MLLIIFGGDQWKCIQILVYTIMNHAALKPHKHGLVAETKQEKGVYSFISKCEIVHFFT